jgi:hypothetical protein
MSTSQFALGLLLVFGLAVSIFVQVVARAIGGETEQDANPSDLIAPPTAKSEKRKPAQA